MKFTAIFANDENDEWSTPLAIIKEFEFRGWETEIISIGSNKIGIYHDSNLKTFIQQNKPTDIIMLFDWGRFDSKWLDKRLNSNAFWIQESGDDPQNFDRNFKKSHKFDMILTPDYDSYLEYKKRDRPAYWQTHFADTRTQFNIQHQKPEFVAVTTRGIGNSNFLDTITAHSNGAVGNKNGMNSVKHTTFLNKGLMVLQNSRWGEITRRIFEGMACGKMVLTDRLNDSKKLQELFTDKKDIVLYDDMVDCINKMNYYKEHNKERDLIMKAGFSNVVKYHTERNRTDFIIKKFKEWKLDTPQKT